MIEEEGGIEQEKLTPRESLLLGLGTMTEEEIAAGPTHVDRRMREILYGFENAGSERIEIPDQDKLVALLLLEGQVGDKYIEEFRDADSGEPQSSALLQNIRQKRQIVEARMRRDGNRVQIDNADAVLAKIKRVRAAGKGQSRPGGTPAS